MLGFFNFIRLVTMRNAILVLMTALAAGCGQKGPLYLRDKPPPGAKPQQEEPYRPKPYPKDATRDAAPAEPGSDASNR
jgi:predicted small lipoprotein YifL